MNFQAQWNLSTIPDELLRAEWARRNSHRRNTFAGGRPPAELQCPFCHEEPFTTIELRGHRPGCRQDRLAALEGRTIDILTVDDPGQIDFKVLFVTRETVRLQKIGTQGSENLSSTKVEIPATAVRHIELTTLTIEGSLRFNRNHGWEYLPPAASQP
jgi:hypothetical protein